MNEEKTVVEEQQDVGSMDNDELKGAINETMKKLRTQSMLLGAQAMCSTMLQKITEFELKPGKRTLNDHRRLVNDIKKFCEVGVSRKVNLDGTTEEKTEESES